MDATSMVERPAQHMRALQRANRVRLARSELKQRIARGEVDPAEVIAACPWEAETMEIAELLRSQRRWGDTRCRRFLERLGMPETKELGSLTDRQRDETVRMLSAPEGCDDVAITPLWAATAA